MLCEYSCHVQVKKFGKGLDVMSEEDRLVVTNKCGPLMKRFGYEVANLFA